MTFDEIELAFTLTREDRAKAQKVLDDQSLRSRNVILYILSRRGLSFGISIFALCVIAYMLVFITPQILRGDLNNILQPKRIVALLILVFVLLCIAPGLWKSCMRFFRPERPRLVAGEGVLWGPQRLVATGDGLTIRLASCSSDYRWSAFSGLHRTRNLVLLLLTPRSAVAVPVEAFRTKQEEQSFCDFVNTQITAAGPVP